MVLIKNINFFEKDHEHISIVKDGAGVGRTYYCPKKSSILGTMQYLTNKSNFNLNYIFYLISTIQFEKYII